MIRTLKVVGGPGPGAVRGAVGALVTGLVVAVGLGWSTVAGASVSPGSEWGFEQVTPSDKGGGSVQAIDTFQAKADGRAFLLSASAPFEAVPAESAPLYTRYLASRTDSQWENRPLDVPFDPVPPAGNSVIMTVVGTSTDLRYAVVVSTRALAVGAVEGGGNVYLRDTTNGGYRLIAAHSSKRLAWEFATTMGALAVKYVAADGKAVVFASPVSLVDGVPEGSAAGTLYRWTEAGGIEVVSKLPDSEGGGYVFAGTSVGYNNEDEARQSLPRENGADVIYFSSLIEDPQQGNLRGPAYRWDNGEVSAISGSQIPGDSGAPVGADVRATTSNGDFALIQTRMTARLTVDTPSFNPGTPGEGGGRVLYRYDRASGALTYVGVADVETFQSVEQMSADGQTVVFKTQHQLTPDAPEYFGSGDPRNRRSLYVWRAGDLRFVAAMDPGARADGTGYLRVLSENGLYLAFTDNSQGTASRFGIADNSSARCAPAGAGSPAPCDQVYLFDAAHSELVCASCRPGGAPPRGQSGDPGITQGPMLMNGRQVQTVADDGTVFFTSSEDLVDEDSNGLLDAYAYRGGALRLVSGGVQGANARFLDATPDGTSIFFATNAQLAETDNDRAVDVYVTRLGAGYPDARAPELPPCEGGNCRAPAPSAGAGAGGGGGSEAVIGGPASRSGTRKATVRLTRVERRKNALRVSVRTSVAGQVRASGQQVRPTSRQASRAGDLTFTVPLTKTARAAIRKNGRVRTRIRVSLTPPFGKSAVTTSTRTVR